MFSNVILSGICTGEKKKKKKKKKKDTLQGGIGYLVLMSIFGFLED
jgi:hypothetical protein